MAASDRPARFGPFHRRTYIDPTENEKLSASGQLWGRPRRNIYAGSIPAVKAWDGPLPQESSVSNSLPTLHLIRVGRLVGRNGAKVGPALSFSSDPSWWRSLLS
jgi:hypothetical protein